VLAQSLLRLLAAHGSAAITPDDVPGLVSWWDAADTGTISFSAGSLVSQWNDKSGNAHHLTVLSGAPDSGIETKNSLNVVTFSNDELVDASSTNTYEFLHNGTSHHVFAVVKFGTGANPNAAYGLLGTNAANGAATGAYIDYDDRSASSRNDRLQHAVTKSTGFGGNEPVNNFSADNACTANTWHVVDVAGDADNGTAALRSSIRVDNGTAIANNVLTNSVVSTASSHSLSVGSTGNSVLKLTGSIAELIIYDQAVTAVNRTKLLAYFSAKWAV
jgi:hypothetical protein